MATYGSGLYGAGSYAAVGDGGGPPTPVVTPPPSWRPPQVPNHILGIGPWSPSIVWRGAANYGVSWGTRPARPTIAMPPAQSQGFTLRLNAGSEANANFDLPRSSAVIIEELATDLWWQRRDPNTLTTEIIGRFNASNVDTSSSGGSVTANCQFVDYRTQLEERIVDRYRDNGNPAAVPPVPPSSTWTLGTPVIEVLRFAVPTNMGLDLSEIAAVGGVDLGNITAAYEMPLGLTVAEVFNGLLVISPAPWEWWVDIDSTGDAPALHFAIGQRGSDKGVDLVDPGTGQTPIAAWSMQAAADRYANSLYFSGDVEGVVVQLDDQVALYGQRDAQDSDAALVGKTSALLIAAANKRLAELADRSPTWTIELTAGFWRGRAHIDVGDTVGVTIRLGTELVTGRHRVTEITCNIDASGAETVSLTLGVPLPSANPRSRKSALARLVRKLKNFERQATTTP